jgi:hypothetical protein
MKNFALLLTATFLSLSPVFSLSKNSSSEEIRLISNLYVVTAAGNPILLDGTLTMYSTDFSNDLDRYDARKMTNPGENWGMVRSNKVYIVERRHIIEGTDSVFFKMWNMRQGTNYRVQFITANLNFPGRSAVLIDNYLKTSVPIGLNDTTYFNFNITGEAASAAANRFSLIISNSVSEGLAPVEFIFSNAARTNQIINVSWKAENIAKGDIFSIQKSGDGIHFVDAAEVNVSDPAKSQYEYADKTPKEGDNYYRIGTADKNGTLSYSKTMKVNVAAESGDVTVYPNPATADNLNLKLSNLTPGEYNIRIINSFGQVFLQKKVQYNGGVAIEKIQPAQKVPSGIYRVEIISPDGKRKIVSIVF